MLLQTHFVLSMVLALPFTTNWKYILLIGVGAVIVDVDHLLYQFIVCKNRTIKNVKKNL